MFALASAVCACRTTVAEAPAGIAAAQPLVLEPQRQWRLLDGDRCVGVVVCFATRVDALNPARHYYSVRNELHQELGTIDAHGRAWRFEPHQSAPRFLGTGALLDGARAVLGASSHAQLIEAEQGAGAR